MTKSLIAPSILASDWGHVEDEVRAVETAGADLIHLDVMDGHFVPPITFGPDFVKAVKRATKLFLDVHLMIEKPENQIAAFAEAGAGNITVHAEACPHLHRTIQQIHSHGIKAGVAVNPGTPLELIEEVLPIVDLVLVMTVNPGWGGQSFIESSPQKIARAREMIVQSKRQIDLEVDGGMNDNTIKVARAAGAEVFVVGTYIFQQKGKYQQAIASLR